MKIIITSEEELERIINKCLKEGMEKTPTSIVENTHKLLYSYKELAKALGCSVQKAFELKTSGQIRYVQYGRKLIFNLAEVLEDLNKCGGFRKKRGKLC